MLRVSVVDMLSTLPRTQCLLFCFGLLISACMVWQKDDVSVHGGRKIKPLLAVNQ